MSEDERQGAGREQHGEHPALGAKRPRRREQSIVPDLVGREEDEQRQAERRDVLYLVEAVGEVLRLAPRELQPGEHRHGGGEVDEVMDQLSRHCQAAGDGGDHGVKRREQDVQPDRIPSPALDVHGDASRAVSAARDE
jgi:hypothetical protein